jgi:hypothetical protein
MLAGILSFYAHNKIEQDKTIISFIAELRLKCGRRGSDSAIKTPSPAEAGKV